jgi:flagellar basal-body rod protein FlgB
VLAGNIANLDTPGYRARDLDVASFERTLADAVTQSRQPARGPSHVPPPILPPGVSPGELAEREEGANWDAVEESMHGILYHDGTDMSLEKQVTEITKNQLLHNLALSIMNSQFRLMQTAISERV